MASFRYLRDPYNFYRSEVARHGDPFGCVTMDGPLLCTGRPDLVKDIFSSPPDRFEPWGTDALEPALGPRSVLLMHGEAHRRERKLLGPPFGGQRMRAYGERITAITRRLAATWAPDHVQDLHDVGQSVSLDVIIDAVLGIDDPERIDEWRHRITDTLDLSQGAFLIFAILRGPWWRPWVRFLRAREALDRLLYDELSTRRATGAEGSDITSLLLGATYEDGGTMEDAQIRDELVTLLFAGHETTAIAIAWAMDWVVRNPEIFGRLREELDATGDDPDAIQRLPYLDGVVQESLRLNPIVPDIARRTREPFALGGVEIPVGEAVSISSYLLHMNPDTFPEPERFDPERFIARKPTPAEFIPFGGGARRCLGASFAVYEAKIVIATLIREHDWQTCGAQPTPVRRNILMCPAGGAPLLHCGVRSTRGAKSGSLRS